MVVVELRFLGARLLCIFGGDKKTGANLQKIRGGHKKTLLY